MIQEIAQWINRLDSHRWHDVIFDPIVVWTFVGFIIFTIIWTILFIREIKKN